MFSEILLLIVVEIVKLSWCSQLRYTEVTEYAPLASIAFTTNRAVICAGTLLSKNEIVTSYFCAADVNVNESIFTLRNPETLKVQIGSRYLYKYDKKGFFANVKEIKPHVNMHINTRAHLLGNDAAVFTISKRLAAFAEFPIKPIEKLFPLYDGKHYWQNDCELLGWHLGSVTLDEAKAAGVPFDQRNNTKQALKVFYISDSQCVEELCAYEKKYCELHLKKWGMFCVKAKEPRFKKYGNVTQGTCYNVIGNPLFCKYRPSDSPTIFGMGAFINIQYCVEENIPMIMVKANVMLDVLIQPRPKKSEAHKLIFSIATMTILIQFHNL